MNVNKVLFIATIFVLLSSCGGGKTSMRSGIPNSTLALNELIKIHNAASPHFKTMAAKIKLYYENENNAQNIGISLRMEKDKVIWIKASLLGVTLAKVLITPDKVSYYEKLSGSYFVGDFALINHWLGTELNFEKIQGILLGQSIFELNDSDYSVTIFNNKYKVQPRIQPPNFIHTLLLNADNFKVSFANLSQPDQDRMFTVNYGKDQKIDGAFYPSNITINSSEKKNKTRIELDYKKIDLNVDLGFPFVIPDGYEEIHLN